MTPPAPEPPGPSQPPSGPPAPEPARPPAAGAVVQGRTEHEIELETELDNERKAHATTATEKKQRELRISELEDELRRLREPPRDPPQPRKKKSPSGMREFLGWES